MDSRSQEDDPHLGLWLWRIGESVELVHTHAKICTFLAQSFAESARLIFGSREPNRLSVENATKSHTRVPAWIPEICGVIWPRINELSTNYSRFRRDLVLQSSGVIAVFAEIVVMSKRAQKMQGSAAHFEARQMGTV